MKHPVGVGERSIQAVITDNPKLELALAEDLVAANAEFMHEDLNKIITIIEETECSDSLRNAAESLQTQIVNYRNTAVVEFFK